MANSTSSSTRLIRMRALSPAELPAHPALAQQQTGASPPALHDFLAAALDEGETFMTSYLPKNFQIKSQTKRSPPATAPVELLAHDRRPEGSDTSGSSTEAWFARTSIHENAAKDGTADWTEFDQGLRANHSQHEADYTPSVRDAHRVLDWNSELEGERGRVGQWELVELVIMEMVHRIPSPLNDRVFPVAVVTAQKPDQFLVVQIPVNLAGVAEAKYAASQNSVTIGMYCSVELGQLIEESTKVKWQMATASDAKGVLPMWMQKLGVPGAVVKDVGWFIEWTSKNRRGRK